MPLKHTAFLWIPDVPPPPLRRGIFCGGHSRHRIPLAKSYAALYRAAAEEGADPRHHRVCDVCHGEYRNALRKYSGTEALAHTFKVRSW